MATKKKPRAGSSPATRRSPSGGSRQPQARPQRGRAPAPAVDTRLVAAGVIALAGLVYLVGAGLGAGILVAGIVAAVLYVARTIRTVAAGERPLVAAQKGVLLSLVFLLPVVIDPRTADVFAVVKFSVLVTGGVALLALYVGDLVVRRGEHRLTLVHGLAAFLVVWAVVATIASHHAKLSMLGFYSSNNGLFAIVALALVLVVTAGAFRARDVSSIVAMMWCATTGVIVLYGVLQLLDQAWPGHGLEPIHWPGGVGVRVFGTTGVWSTFGNPNHFGGYCAIALPLGIATFIGATSVAQRVVTALIGAGAIVVIGQTSSRGAWVAAAVGVVLMAVLGRQLIVDAVRRRKWLLPAGVVVAAGSVAASLNTGLLSKGSSALFEAGSSSTIAQRVQFWKTTLSMAADRPILGFGMDGYRLTFPHYAPMRFIRLWGYDLSVTGPHNTFFNLLYWGGWPALVAFVALVVAAGIRFARGRRALDQSGTAASTSLALSAIAVSAVAFLLVESFNVERVELAVLFWFAAGLIVAVSREAATGVLDTTTSVPSGRRRAVRRRGSGDVGVIVAAAVVTVALLFLTTAPWRADNSLRSAGVASGAARSLTSSNPQLAQARSQASRRDIDAAVSANPWEARYIRARAEAVRASAVSLQQQGRSADAQALLQKAARDYATARRLTPHEPSLVGASAEVLYRIADTTGDTRSADEATRLLVRETRYAPKNGRLRAFLGLQRIAHGQRGPGLRDLDAAVAMFPKDTAVLTYAVSGYQTAGLQVKATQVQQRLERLAKAND